MNKLMKCSTDRLRKRMADYGVKPEIIAAMSRTALLENVAEFMSTPEAGEDPDLPITELEGAVGGSPLDHDVKPMSVWEKELELKERELRLKEEFF